MKIREICGEDRPREKLLSKGAGALGNNELLAILLRSGTAKASVLDVAGQLLGSTGGNLTALSLMGADKLCDVPGIGPDKAATVMAAFELGRRCASESPQGCRTRITRPHQAWRLLAPRLKGLSHEECWVIFLSRAGMPTAVEMLGRGGLDATPLDARVVVRRALDCKAAAIILSHNHPSNDPRPGKADIAETARLKNALKTFDISLLDHIIIADDCCYSFSLERLIYKRELESGTTEAPVG